MATKPDNPNRNHNPHILVFPYPAQGHMLPLLDLTHQLCLHNLKITILVTPENLPYLSDLLSAHTTAITPLVLPFPPHPSVPAGVENVKDLGNAGNIPISSALRKLRDPIVDWFHSHEDPPVAIVSDFFLGWTLHLARSLSIPRFAFFCSPAFLASVVDFCWNNVDYIKASADPIPLPDLPRSPVFKEAHLPSLFRRYMKSESDPEIGPLKDSLVANTLSDGCIINSFDILEGEYFGYMQKKMGNNRVFGVGPLSLMGLDPSGRGNLGRQMDLDANILRFLDGCPDGSVVYVCFGSQKLLSREQMEALASGLEKSMARFLWVVKTGTTEQLRDGYGLVPEGFEERVAGRGLVVKGWAPQVVVLSHKAVGGFLSHCGWNSVLEGIVGGAMILAWPMEADQFVNAKQLVEHLGMAVKVCEGANSVPDSDELGRKIAESMGDEGRVKVRAREMTEKALAAVRSGGSSYFDLERLVGELAQLRATK